jgi:hypothetical protein
MHQPSEHTIKAVLPKPGNLLEIRRFKVPYSIEYEELVEILQQTFQLEVDISIQYRDNESDLCKITNDMELSEAFDAAEDADVLKLELVTTGCHKANAATPLDSINIVSEEFWSDSEIRSAVTDVYQRFVEAIMPLVETFEKKAGNITSSLPNPKAMFESFLNDPSAFAKKPFQAFVNNLDEWLAEIDLMMHQKSHNETTESNDQPHEPFIHPFKVFYEKFMNEARSFINDLENFLAQFNQKSEQEESARESTPENSDQPFTDSFIRAYNDLFEYKATNEAVESNTTKSETEEPQLFEQQMQELRKMGFLDDDQNLAILMQKNGHILDSVLALLDSY